METRKVRHETSVVGPYAAIGAAMGLVAASLNGADAAIALVFGAAIGLLVGILVDALVPTPTDDEPNADA
jgi:zinc transporter ZupT